jgi:hypothetical protein
MPELIFLQGKESDWKAVIFSGGATGSEETKLRSLRTPAREADGPGQNLFTLPQVNSISHCALTNVSAWLRREHTSRHIARPSALPWRPRRAQALALARRCPP